MGAGTPSRADDFEKSVGSGSTQFDEDGHGGK